MKIPQVHKIRPVKKWFSSLTTLGINCKAGREPSLKGQHQCPSSLTLLWRNGTKSSHPFRLQNRDSSILIIAWLDFTLILIFFILFPRKCYSNISQQYRTVYQMVVIKKAKTKQITQRVPTILISIPFRFVIFLTVTYWARHHYSSLYKSTC